MGIIQTYLRGWSETSMPSCEQAKWEQCVGTAVCRWRASVTSVVVGCFCFRVNIQTCNKLVCNRVGNQIDALDLGVIKSNSFSINGPRPIKMLWDSMILKVIFLKKGRLESVFGLNSRFSYWRRPKYQLLHKYVTSVYCSLCCLCHACIYMLILLSTYKWLYQCLMTLRFLSVWSWAVLITHKKRSHGQVAKIISNSSHVFLFFQYILLDKRIVSEMLEFNWLWFHLCLLVKQGIFAA